MTPRPGDQHDLEAQITQIVLRYPGLTMQVLANRLGRSCPTVDKAVRRLMEKERVDFRVITDPDSQFYGKMGVFYMTRNPL